MFARATSVERDRDDLLWSLWLCVRAGLSLDDSNLDSESLYTPVQHGLPQIRG